ncbi:response regulator transcription factor [Hasllibacter sp. MH4015]|uniref:response regulator n=1 Tax=Hasllibacter sp. MH4015 TaxID=2854029 RepID=UPI001CD30D45|nr:response regulator transcription factor [Hasllibacter sp. MH4015]
MTRRYTGMLADDHKIVRMGLRTALTHDDAMHDTPVDIVAEAEDGLQTIQAVKTHRPDLLILDVSMPIASGAEIVADVQRWSPDTKVVVYSAVTSPGLLAHLIEAGVHGLFAKGSDAGGMLAALPLILRGGRQVEPAILDLVRGAPEPASLTARERQTLNMVLAGKTNAEVARLMGISPKTAEKHRASMMAKLEVRTLAELMAKALQDGLIEQHGLM